MELRDDLLGFFPGNLTHLIRQLQSPLNALYATTQGIHLTACLGITVHYLGNEMLQSTHPLL